MLNKEKKKMITIEEFTKVSQMLTLTKFCKDAGVSYSKIWQKIRFKRELTILEANAISNQLDKLGINYNGV